MKMITSKFKCGKAAGPDGLNNEFFKYSRNVCQSCLMSYCYLVLYIKSGLMAGLC